MIYLISAQQEAFEGQFTQISVKEAIAGLRKLPEIANDTETSGLSCHSKKLLLVQLGNFDIQYVFDIASYNGRIPQELKDFMNDYDGVWILQNAKFDLQFYFKQGVILKHIYDTMLAEFIITMGYQEFRDGKMKDVKRDLKTIAHKYCDIELDKSVRGEIIRTGLNARVIAYGANDIAYLPEIKEKQLKEVKQRDLLPAVMLDNRFVRVLAYIEYCGIKLDWDKWAVKAQKYLDAFIAAKEDLDSYVCAQKPELIVYARDLFSDKPSSNINWASSKQVIPMLESFGVNCSYYEKGELKKSCSEKVLKFQINQFEILKKFFKFQEAAKQNSTYGFSWKSMINPNTGRIHTSYRQIQATGRLACGDMGNNQPNLQNLPNDKYTRSCFIAESGNKYIAVDYSAQESIVLANFANDQSLINFYRKGLTDMHSYVALLLYPNLLNELGKTIDDITNDDLKWVKDTHHEERQVAKTAEFAIKSYFRLFS
jgi:DNA polymerase I-like protein with 3'-5' exonuclease and polymerase domains